MNIRNQIDGWIRSLRDRLLECASTWGRSLRNRLLGRDGNARRVERAFEAIAEGEGDVGLYFDATTGELRASRDEHGEDADRLPATGMAREGFFVGCAEVGRTAPAPQLVPASENSPRHLASPEPAVAETVEEKPHYVLFFDHRSGELCARGSEGDEDIDRLPATQMAREGFFAEGTDAVSGNPDDPMDAFSRNAPVLETDALAQRSVLVVGLGSGGSTVADLLARSGVGNFVLWDNDCLEVHNVARHICTRQDLGRRKVDAVRDHILSINPNAEVTTVHEDATAALDDLSAMVERVDCVVAGTDNNASRFAVNAAAIGASKPAYFGRAFTRACGGDVIQVLPHRETPCYACHVEGRPVEEEVSSERDAERVAYADKPVAVEPGLAVDIQPIANMIARLVVLRLCVDTDSSLVETAHELDAPYYLWANRRQENFAAWQPMQRSYRELAILRWYAIDVKKSPECMVCQ